MIALFLLALSTPCVSVTSGGEQRSTLEAAGIERLCTEADLANREALPTSGTAPRAELASPTRSPWIVANGWRFMRHPERRYVYDVPSGKAALAAAEVFAYGADAALKIDSADALLLGAMLGFLNALPSRTLPPESDIAIVDDGSAMTGEVMNLLARRNLMFEVVPEATLRFRINIKIGAPEYPRGPEPISRKRLRLHMDDLRLRGRAPRDYRSIDGALHSASMNPSLNHRDHVRNTIFAGLPIGVYWSVNKSWLPLIR